MDALFRAKVLNFLHERFIELRKRLGFLYIQAKPKGVQPMLKIGDTFPAARITTEAGPVDIKGHPYTAFYFYPKDDTPGCTIEANEFQQLKGEYDSRNIRILGVSVDDAASHRAFCEKFALTFELATDAGGKAGSEMGIMSGAVHKRVTFVVNESGKVVLEYPEVKPAGHAQKILDDLAAI